MEYLKEKGAELATVPEKMKPASYLYRTPFQLYKNGFNRVYSQGNILLSGTELICKLIHETELTATADPESIQLASEQGGTLNRRTTSRMLPKLVTSNVTNDRG